MSAKDLSSFDLLDLWSGKNSRDGMWTFEQTRDLMNRQNPLYPPNLLRRIFSLERRIAALEAENEALKAGK